MRLDVNVFGDRSLQQRLRLIRTQADAPRDALNRIADDFLDIERARFAGGARWRPLKATTIASKAEQGRSALPLAGGPLERSLTVRGAKGSVRRVQNAGMVVGTRNPVARIHQGSKEEPRRPRGGRLPRRPIVSIGPVDQERWRDLFADHLMRGDRAFRPGL